MGNGITHASVGTILTQAEWESVDAHSGGTGRVATYVVAASNATTSEKAQADVTCDGVNDEDTYNDAADTLTGGGIIQLTSGTYEIGGFLDPHDNIWTRGMGRATILNCALTNNVGFHAGADGIAARTGFVISDLLIQGNYVDTDNNNDTSLFQFEDCTNYRLQNIVANYSQSTAFYAIGALTSNVTIVNFEGIGSSRGLIEIAEGVKYRLHNITSWGNNQSGNGMDINFEAGAARILSDILIDTLYVSVTSTDPDAYAASFNSDTRTLTDVILSNVILDGGVYGLVVRGTDGVKLIGGKIKNATNALALSSSSTNVNFSASNIDITGAETRGLWLQSDGTVTADNLRFDHININGGGTTRWGITVSGAPNNDLTHCFLTDSQVFNCDEANINDSGGKITQTDVQTW